MLTLQTKNHRIQIRDRRLKTTFLHLPAEIRNTIYHLSGCLEIVVCEQCAKACSKDLVTMGLERSCSGSARIGIPVRWPRHWVCGFNNTTTSGIDIARYITLDQHIKHEFINPKTGRPAFSTTTTTLLPPNLTAVSRQIRSETLPIFYGTNTFIFTPKISSSSTGTGSLSPTDNSWLTAISRSNTSLIRSIQIRWLGWCRRALLENFKTELKDLGIRIDEDVEVEVSCWTNEERWSSGFEGERLRYIAP